MERFDHRLCCSTNNPPVSSKQNLSRLRRYHWVPGLSTVVLMANPEDPNAPGQGSECGSILPSSGLPGMESHECNQCEELKRLKQMLVQLDQEMARMVPVRDQTEKTFGKS